jgi:uncharacterized protein involved in outer membrane biogenesis
MSFTPRNIRQIFAARPRLRRSLVGVLALLAIYAVLGATVLPAVLRSQAEKILTEKLQRPASIGGVRFNPFTLVLTVRDLQLQETKGTAVFVRFDSLVLNLSTESLFRLAPVVQRLSVSRPYVHLVRSAANQYNIDDIVAMLAALPPSTEPARFAVNNIELAGGRIEFDDQPEHLTHVVDDIKLGVPFISSLPSQVAVFVEPHLSALVNGAPLAFTGRAHPYTENRDAQLDLHLDKFDLTHYVEYLPVKPAFKVDGALLDLHLQASFVQPKGRTPGISLAGTAALKNVSLTGADGKPLLKLPQLDVAIAKADLFKGEIDLSRIAIDGLELNLQRARDGSLKLLAQEAPVAPAKTTPAATTAAPVAPASPAAGLHVNLAELILHGATLRYNDQHPAVLLGVDASKLDLALHGLDFDTGKRSFTVADIALDQGKLHVEDRRHRQPLAVDVGPLHLGVKNLSNGTTPASFDLQAAISQGKLALNGQFALAPLTTELTLAIKNLDLLPLQPLLADRLSLRVTHANLNAQGAVHLAQAKDGSWQGGFKGDLGLANLSTVDKIGTNDFLRWANLQFDGVDVRITPLAVNIAQVALKDFFARVILDSSGRINLQDVLAPAPVPVVPANKPASVTSAAAASVAALPPTPPSTPAAVTPVTVGKFLLQGGRIRYSDNFIKPNYSATLQDLVGSVTGLSSDPASTAQVDLKGQVNGAPLLIAGKINPLKGDLSLDLKASVRGMELPPLSPYSGHYIGYGIDRGKLSFEVNYVLEQRRLTAQNRLILDQLRFGEASKEPGATSLPVHFALALLQDRNGVVDINLPIEGTLDDPQFSLGGLIGRMIGNLITKAVSAPFTLLASLFGEGGEELSAISFEPGRAALPDGSAASLQSLTKALTERPALQMDITGSVDAERDRAGLKRVALERKMRAQKAGAQKGGPAVANASVSISALEYPVLLAQVYQAEKFAKPSNVLGLAKTLPPAEMEQLILANTTISDDDLHALGNRRAENVKAQLVRTGGIDAQRLYLVDAKTGSAKVEFTLK